jgi:hypothetical protein
MPRPRWPPSSSRIPDRHAAIVRLARDTRAAYGDSLAWQRLVRKVARVVRETSLWGLQRIGTEQLNFLYENQGDSRAIQLLPGVAFCFRKFHALISDSVPRAWVRYVRQQNLNVVGESADLNEFLFGSKRATRHWYGRCSTSRRSSSSSLRSLRSVLPKLPLASATR